MRSHACCGGRARKCPCEKERRVRVQGASARACCDAVRHLDAEAHPGAALVAVARLHLPAGNRIGQAGARAGRRASTGEEIATSGSSSSSSGSRENQQQSRAVAGRWQQRLRKGASHLSALSSSSVPLPRSTSWTPSASREAGRGGNVSRQEGQAGGARRLAGASCHPGKQAHHLVPPGALTAHEPVVVVPDKVHALLIV